MSRDVQTKREREKAMVSDMIALYCKKQHGTKRGLCPACAVLTDYARATATCRRCGRISVRSCGFLGQECCSTTQWRRSVM